VITLTPIFIFFWALLTSFFAFSFILSLYSSLKLLEFTLLFFIALSIFVPRETSPQKTPLVKAFIGLGVVESIIGILQFVFQKSLGLTLLKESIISPSTAGVAKIIFHSEPLIRAYGTFPHPNIFGGFLLVTILTTFASLRLFLVEHSQNTQKILKISLIVQLLALLLTFSKAAILGLVLALSSILIVPRETSLLSTLFREPFSKRIFHGILLGVFFLSTIFFWQGIQKDSFFFQSIREREVYTSLALLAAYNHPFLGISCGQLVIFSSQQATYPLFDWQFQPVHNVPLLILAELGSIGCAFFLLWYITLATVLWRYRQIKKALFGFALLLGLLPPLLFDHYLWDIQQGQLIFWLCMSYCGVVALSCINHENSAGKGDSKT
jgi:hypothetical protein